MLQQIAHLELGQTKTMSLALHAGVFAAGLAIGAVAVTATSSASTSKLPAPLTPSTREERQSNPGTSKLQSLVPQSDNGALQRVNSTTAVEVLKYGFPGESILLGLAQQKLATDLLVFIDRIFFFTPCRTCI